MRGRKPKPTKIKELTGNPGKRPLNQDEPQYSSVSTYAPRELSAEAKKEWKRVVKMLTAAGVYTDADRAALMAYCMAYAMMIKADAMVRETGMIVETVKGNIIQNPYLSVRNKQMELMKGLATEFGMTPSSRSRIKAEAPEVDVSLAEMLFESVKDGG